jgi:glyoxylase-like metal-dependent hydrolase (beta-lactamase superfamily II)
LQRSAIAASAALALPFGRAARSQPAALDTVRLSDQMLAVLGPDANSLVVQSSDGMILVDGGHAAWSDALLRQVDAAFARQPIGTLINTHWHPEQTGSNVTLGRQGVEIIAHENTKLWLGTDVRVRWSDEKYPALPAAGIPDTTIYDSDNMQLAERTIECRYLRNAHTDGDLCVFFPDDNVLVTGGPVSNDGWPVIDWWTGGWMGGMLDAFDVLLEIADENTRIVPSSGPLMSLTDLQSQQEMYLTIFERIQSMLRNSYGTDEVLAARPTAEFDAQWGDPEQFVTLAFHSMWGHLRDAYDTRLRNIP